MVIQNRAELILTEPRRIREEILDLMGEIAILKARAEHSGSNTGSAGGFQGVNTRGRENAAIAYSRALDRYSEAVKQLNAAEERAQELIAGLGNPRHRTVLTLFYIERMSVLDISEFMSRGEKSFSESSVYRLRREALSLAAGLLREE